MELTGKTAVVTGASGGLGGEIAAGLARAGCDVVVHYNTNLQGAERTALMVRQAGRKAAIVQADLRELLCAGVRGIAPKTGGSAQYAGAKCAELFSPRAGFGPVRILVNSAAIFGRTPVGSIGIEEASKIVEMDLLVPVLLSQEFVKFLTKERVESRQETGGKSEIRNSKLETNLNDGNAKAQNEEKTHGQDGRATSEEKREEGARGEGGGQRTADSGQEEIRGKIVNIADVGGERPWKGYSVYCGAKAGLIAATKALAKELAPGVTVNAVAPGLVTWPEGMDAAGKARQLGFIPAGRVARPEEIAAAVVFLLQNDHITGQVINVDGGRSA